MIKCDFCSNIYAADVKSGNYQPVNVGCNSKTCSEALNRMMEYQRLTHHSKQKEVTVNKNYNHNGGKRK